ncbi:MAG: helix-turn-helix transcriptional regulator [Candidatus Eremiobacteraeota bacterium]|nr:helix-turn-helix transcriptional regulator [Candidatus Eremiobacteraeota bacterium]
MGARARALRLARGLRQADVAKAAGITIPTLVRFEHTGRVGFEAVVAIALALGAELDVARLFEPPLARSIDEIVASARGRRRAPRRR